MAVESAGDRRSSAPAPRLEIRLLGPLMLLRDGRETSLPPSRKVRALLGYLALARAPVGRSELCEMLWEVPSDPRGELRWCLSKLRGLIDDPSRKRLQARRDAVALELSDVVVDALAVPNAFGSDAAALDVDASRRALALFRGDLLQGLDIDHSPIFDAWLAAQRRRYRDAHTALLERLSGLVAGEEALGALEELLRLNPFDLTMHARLLGELARRGRMREGEAHLQATARLFTADGLDPSPLRAAWARSRTVPAAPTSTPPVDATPLPVGPVEPPSTLRASRRASIAIMPFTEAGPADPARAWLPAALAHDVITRLAKLRTLFVIAQGSVLALHERRVGVHGSARMLGVDYVMGGTLLRAGERIVVQAELLETRSKRVIWAETFDSPLRNALDILDSIGNRIVSSIVAEIEAVECSRAVLKPPESLDAWEAYHRGLWHMYRFTHADNGHARQFFEQSLKLDPRFSRALAGLSFTHWQDVFQSWSNDPARSMQMAKATALESLEADDRDPGAHWALGRALWLTGRHDEAVTELEQSVHLSPNFALAHYNLAFVHSTTGDPTAAVGFSDHSRELSPFDPMLFGMLGARSIALVRLGRFGEAADWGLKAASRPNAFTHIRGIAAFSLALADRMDEARAQLALMHEAAPGYAFADFQRAFRFGSSAMPIFREGARRLGVA